MLYTPTEELDPRVEAEITRLGVDRAIILGGEDAISADVQTALEGLVGTVDRLEGPTRTETAIAVTEESGATTAVLARSHDAEGGDSSQAFADSITAGAWAAAEGYGVLLTLTDELTGSTADFLAEGSIDSVIIVGGTAAVSDEVEAAVAEIVPDTTRVGGENRAETAVDVATERGYASADDAAGVILVEGFTEDAWTDGFAAAATSAHGDYPVVLSNGDDLPPETEAWASGAAAAFAQAGPGGPVVVCGALVTVAACEAFAALVGAVSLTLDVTDLEAGDDITGTITGLPDGTTVTVSGCGFTDEDVTVEDDGTFTVPGFPGTPDEADGDSCVLTFTFTDEDGNTFTRTATITIATAAVPPTDVLIPISSRIVNQTATQILIGVLFNNEIGPGGIPASQFWAYGPTEQLQNSNGGIGNTSGTRNPDNTSEALVLFDIHSVMQDHLTTVAAQEGAVETPDGDQSAYGDVAVQQVTLAPGVALGPSPVSAGPFDDGATDLAEGTEVSVTVVSIDDSATLVASPPAMRS